MMKKSEEIYERINKKIQEYEKEKKESEKAYYDSQEPLILSFLALDDDFKGFCDFLNGEGCFNETYVSSKDYPCQIPEDMASEIFDLVYVRASKGIPFSFSRDSLVSLLNDAYEKTDSLIPCKESPLFDENHAFTETFIAFCLFEPDLREKTMAFVQALSDVDSVVLSTERRMEYKSALSSSFLLSASLSFPSLLGEDWVSDVYDVASAFGIDPLTASGVIYASNQTYTGIEDSASLISALTKVEKALPLRLDDTFILCPGCDIWEDLNVSEDVKRVKEAFFALLGSPVPGRYYSSLKEAPDKELLNFCRKLSFGYDETNVRYLQNLIRGLGSDCLREETPDSESLSKAVQTKSFGYKAEVFGCDEEMFDRVLGLKDDSLLVSFMNDSKHFSDGSLEKVLWPVSLVTTLEEAYPLPESLPSAFSRRELNRALNYVLCTPSPSIVFLPDDRDSVMDCLICSSVNNGCSFEKTKNTFAAFVNLNLYVSEHKMSESQLNFLTGKLWHYACGDFFDNPRSSLLSDPENFSKFADGILDGSLSDVDIALKAGEEEPPVSEKGKEEEER